MLPKAITEKITELNKDGRFKSGGKFPRKCGQAIDSDKKDIVHNNDKNTYLGVSKTKSIFLQYSTRIRKNAQRQQKVNKSA
jgi:hypothetical protein